MRKNAMILVWLTVFFMICITQSSHAQDIGNYELLKGEFKSPPMKSWPKTYWWWLNGNIDTVRIKEEIISMKKAGLSGFDIFEIGKLETDTIIPTGEITFMGDDFLRAVKVAVDQAAKLNMEVGLNMASSWNAGGAWVTPENSAKSIYFSKISYKGTKIKLPFPKLVRSKIEGKIVLSEDQNSIDIEYAKNGKPVFYKEIVILAVPTINSKTEVSEVIDVSSYFDSESEILDWNHEGEYDIYRYVCSNSGEQLKLPSENSAGPIIDHFNSQATESHFNHVINRLKTALGSDLSKTALKSLYLASYEALGNVWTVSLPQEFKKLNGYDIYPFIPALFDKTMFSEDVTSKFKKDFQFTLSELMITNFYKKAREICNANGLLINSESGGPGFPLHNVPAEPLKSLGAMDLPRGEFWVNHNRFNPADGIDILRVVKEVSSASHIYGRGVVEMEAFTSFQSWQEGPFDIKSIGDRAFCEGMNRVVFHGSSHNPQGIGSPGIAYHAGTHYNDKRVWWPMVKPFNTYLSRISNVFQKTSFVADVLYYYGDAVPNYGGHKNSRFTVGPGYDYEIINTEILKQITVKNGKLVLPTGGEFSVLALENEGEIDPEVLLKLKTMVNQGAKIVSERPNKIIVRENLPELKVDIKEIDKLWLDVKNSKDNVMSKKNKVFSGITPITILKHLDILPDFTYEDAEFSTLDYIHYKNGAADYYFVRNTTDQWVSRQTNFRQNGKTPEIWNAVTGEISQVSIYKQVNQHISLPLTLPPYGSLFVVFSEGENASSFSKINSNDFNPPFLNFTNNGTFILNNGFIKLQDEFGEKTVSNYVKTEELKGAWEVFFSELQDTPKRLVFPELISWSKHENGNVKYFSGIAKYVKTFQYGVNLNTVSNQRIYLDLGDLSKVGEVWLNGTNLGIAWTKPYRFDVTDVIKPGDNLLEVKVANTWSNRLKGDAVTGDDFTFTNVTETVVVGMNISRLKWKDVPLIESGLKGPVNLIIMKPID